jgi:AcrR family transcriptional regulator
MSPRTGKPAASADKAGTPANPARRTQQERSSQAEKALMDAATELFARRGVDQTSLADVGEAAGYSRGLVNHHFGTKATLVERLARRAQTDFVANFDEVDGDAIDVLVTLTENYFSALAHGGEATRAFFVMWGAAIPLEATLRPVYATDDARFRFAVEAILRSGQDTKTVAADVDPTGGAVALVGLLRGVSAQYLVDPDAFDISAAKKTCQDFVRRSFAPATRRARSTK